MKKFECFVMVIVLVMTMSISAFARYEGCPDCEARLVTMWWVEEEGFYPCEECGHEVWGWYDCSGECCPECGNYQSYFYRDKKLSCGHES